MSSLCVPSTILHFPFLPTKHNIEFEIIITVLFCLDLLVNSEMVRVANLRLSDIVLKMKLRKPFDISIKISFGHLELFVRSVIYMYVCMSSIQICVIETESHEMCFTIR